MHAAPGCLVVAVHTRKELDAALDEAVDLLKPAAELGIVSVAVSVTSLDPKIARTLEPRAATPPRRLAAIAFD